MVRLASRLSFSSRVSALSGLRFNSSSAYTDMMSTFKQDLKSAMIAKDTIKKNTVRGIMAAVKNKELEANSSAHNEFTLYDMLLKMVNQREESIQEYIKSKRDDLAENEKKEQGIISKYLSALPIATNEEIDVKVKEIVNQMKADSDKPFPAQKVFAKIPWKTIEKEWRASTGAVKQSIVRVHKETFP